MIFRRKRRLAERLLEYRGRVLYYDPYEAGVYVRRVVLEEAARTRPSKIIEILGDVIEVKTLFAFNSIAASGPYVVEVIADYVHEVGLSDREYYRKIMEIITALDRSDADYINAVGSVFASEIVSGTDLLVPAGGSILETVILASRAKLEVVRVPMGEPSLQGVGFAERLHNYGVESFFFPDGLRYWAVRRSQAIVVPFYAVSREGLVIAEPGVEPIVRLAWTYDKDVFLVGTWSALAAYFTVSEIEASGKTRLNGIEVELFDVIDPDEGRLLLVTDKVVVPVTREGLRERSEAIVKKLRDTVITALEGD